MRSERKYGKKFEINLDCVDKKRLST